MVISASHPQIIDSALHRLSPGEQFKAGHLYDALRLMILVTKQAQPVGLDFGRARHGPGYIRIPG